MCGTKIVLLYKVDEVLYSFAESAEAVIVIVTTKVIHTNRRRRACPFLKENNHKMPGVRDVRLDFILNA